MAEQIIQIADKPTLDLINQKIGATADTGGSSTTGTLMAKMNNMLSNAGVVKSVQFGEAAIGSGANAATVTINTVDKTKAVIILRGMNTTASNPGNPGDYLVRAYFTTSKNNELFFYRQNIANNMVQIGWQVVEFY